MTPATHVRVNIRRAGRRINDSRGSAGEALCGGSITAYDVPWADAKRQNADGLAKWVTCPECRYRVVTKRIAEIAEDK